MAPGSFKSSAPGSLMLLGEHAVLHGYGAIVTAIDKRISVELIPRNDEKIILNSAELGEYVTSWVAINPIVNATKEQAGSTKQKESIKQQVKFSYILSVLAELRTYLSNSGYANSTINKFALCKPDIANKNDNSKTNNAGFELKITSEFSSTVGFGSSAAVVVATISVIAKWQNLNFSEEQIFALAKTAVHAVAGVGSGADLAASIWGGTLYYQAEPMICKKLPPLPSLVAIYSGSKLKTPEVIKIVEQQEQRQPQVYQHIFANIGSLVELAVEVCAQEDWQALGKIFSIQQGLMVAMGVSNFKLNHLVASLNKYGASGAKISGSGLGDCVIALAQGVSKELAVEVEEQILGLGVDMDGCI